MRHWILGIAVTMTGIIFDIIIGVYSEAIKAFFGSHGISDQVAVTYLLGSIAAIWIVAGVVVMGSSVVSRLGYRIILFKITRAMPSLPANQRSQGIEIYRNYDELRSNVPLSALFSKAETRINILAIDAGISIKSNRPAFYDALKRGVIVHLLLMDEKSKSLLHEVEKVWPDGGDAYKTLQESLRGLCLLQKELPESKLEIRFFDCLPLDSMIIIDPESDHARMQVTMYRYNTHSWASLTFSKREQKELFASYWQSYQFVDDDKKTRKHVCGGEKPE